MFTSLSQKIFIGALVISQLISSSTWANTSDFLQILEWGFYSNAIPATAGGVVIQGSGGDIFTQSTIWVTTQAPVSPVSNGGWSSWAPLPSSTGQGTSVFSQTPVMRNGITSTPVTSLISQPSFNSAPPAPGPIVSVKNSQSQWVKTSLIRKNSAISPTELSRISILKAQVLLKNIWNTLSLSQGAVVSVRSMQQSPFIAGVIEGDVGQYIVLVTSDRHDYFLRIPVGADGKWSTENTTTPREISQKFMTPGRMNLRISLVEVGGNAPLSQVNQEIFVVTESQLSFGR